MDYSLANAIGHNMDQISRVITFYDINCSYMKKLRARVSNNSLIRVSQDLEIVPGIGIWHVHGHRAECFARYGPLFIPGSGWVDGEIIETLWSILNIVSGSTRGMSSPHRQEFLDFQMNDCNFMKMIRMCKPLYSFLHIPKLSWSLAQSLTRKLKIAKSSSASAAAAFNDLDASVSDEQRELWQKQEKKALERRVTDPSSMDIFELQLRKGEKSRTLKFRSHNADSDKAPSIQAVELEMLQSEQAKGGSHRGVTTWLSRGLKVEAAQISLRRDMRRPGSHATESQRLAVARRADRLASEISGYLSEASAHLGNGYEDELPSADSEEESEDGDEELLDNLGGQRPDQTKLPLPSMLGRSKCRDLGVERLMEQELRLRTGQANDTLHEIRLALAEKAVLFRTDVRHASSHQKTTRAWGKVTSVDGLLQRHASVYRRCRKAMIQLEADKAMLSRYQALRDEDLKVNTAAAAPNARGLRNEKLAWFWGMDVPRDTEANDWMSECKCCCRPSVLNLPRLVVYRVHWLRAKAMRDRWKEEEELLKDEFQWTITFFNHMAQAWEHRSVQNQKEGLKGPACYASRQQAIYSRLRDRCQAIWEGTLLAEQPGGGNIP